MIKVGDKVRWSEQGLKTRFSTYREKNVFTVEEVSEYGNVALKGHPWFVHTSHLEKVEEAVQVEVGMRVTLVRKGGGLSVTGVVAETQPTGKGFQVRLENDVWRSPADYEVEVLGWGVPEVGRAVEVTTNSGGKAVGVYHSETIFGVGLDTGNPVAYPASMIVSGEVRWRYVS